MPTYFLSHGGGPSPYMAAPICEQFRAGWRPYIGAPHLIHADPLGQFYLDVVSFSTELALQFDY